MAIRRIRIDYTVYPPNFHPGETCWDLRTFQRAKAAARGLGPGAKIYRNFNQTNKRGQNLGDWWSGKSFWSWDGVRFRKELDSNLRSIEESERIVQSVRDSLLVLDMLETPPAPNPRLRAAIAAMPIPPGKRA